MKNIISAIEAIGNAIIDNKQYLTDLDAAIGDGDHGINMARGFEAVQNKLKTGEYKDISSVLKAVGMTLISTVGGASGPLYGTAFMRAAGSTAGKTTVDKDTALEMLAAAIGGIKDRGKAVHGEKTMLDALEPAYQAFANSLAEGETLLAGLEAACEAAKQGVEYTKTIVAKKGRASYLGERSLGHQDPGATSSLIMLTALFDFCRGHEGAV